MDYRSFELKGRVALITGAASGIGKEIAEAFVRHGARVVVSDMDREAGSATAAALGDMVRFGACDVSCPDQVRALFADLPAPFDRIDVLVNNAAHNPVRPEDRVPVDVYPADTFRRTIDVDINGTFPCSSVF